MHLHRHGKRGQGCHRLHLLLLLLLSVQKRGANGRCPLLDARPVWSLNGRRPLKHLDGCPTGLPGDLFLPQRTHFVSEERRHALLGAVADGGEVVPSFQCQHNFSLCQGHELLCHVGKARW
uniref:Putative secreted protein n=1 Tax=Ixodes ricinus TaxID=34613 RepID=A0A147BSZ6_IXORI